MSLKKNSGGEFVEDVLDRIHSEIEAGNLTIYTALSGLCFCVVMLLISEKRSVDFPISIIKKQHRAIRIAMNLEKPDLWN
tara:strand:- start:262 stop:501 length:240 start_codon:yes stop_codon:yes gene_type:complete